jgi:8-oxo-dGTP pyrophosphatase MutT (NUDIX family)
MTDVAIPASTLILVRDRDGAAPELLMVERSAEMAFAAGALVFPGGRIDEADVRMGRELGFEDGAAVAAIRETIEETAVAVGLNPVPERETVLELQTELAGDAEFTALLTRMDLKLDAEALTPFARWIPKFHAVRRFDTLFFVAKAVPGDWEPNVIAGECSGAHWLSAADALERGARGQARLIFPTRRNLERLAQHMNFAEIRADALAHPIEPVTPWVEERDGEKFITIPDHLGYPVTEEQLDGLWRG